MGKSVLKPVTYVLVVAAVVCGGWIFWAKIEIGSTGAHAAASSNCGSQSDDCTVFAAAERAAELAKQMQTTLAEAVPHGAVLAFNLDHCPAGWTVFSPATGRVVVGAGPSVNSDQSGAKLATYKLGDNGGRERAPISIEQLPPHNFQVWFQPDRENLQNGGYDLVRALGEPGTKGQTPVNTNTLGKGLPFEVMNPYVALEYCVRN